MRDSTLIVTGNRKVIPKNWKGNSHPSSINTTILEHHQKVKDIVKEFVKTMYIEKQLRTVISGMDRGAEQIFVEAVLELDKNIKIIAAIPFSGIESKWSAFAKDHYNKLLKQVDHVKYIFKPGYAIYKLNRRNKRMVKKSDYCLAIWNGVTFKSTTWNCIRLCIDFGRDIYHLDSTLQSNEIKLFTGSKYLKTKGKNQ
jgi:uncharacterized phage-like protein YoqJ